MIGELGCYKAQYCLGVHYIDRKDKHRVTHWIKATAKNSNNKYKNLIRRIGS